MNWKKKLGIQVKVLSGGNSSIWNMLDSGELPEDINQVRMGEAIFLGHETAGYTKIKGAYQNCFILEAETIEVKARNSTPYRIILALGLQDVLLRDLEICDKRLKSRSQSSDHTMMDIINDPVAGKIGKGFSNFEVGSIIIIVRIHTNSELLVKYCMVPSPLNLIWYFEHQIRYSWAKCPFLLMNVLS